MSRIHFKNNSDKGRGYSFSLFPLFLIEKTKFSKVTQTDIYIGIWFWSIEINSTKERF